MRSLSDLARVGPSEGSRAFRKVRRVGLRKYGPTWPHRGSMSERLSPFSIRSNGSGEAK